MANCSYCRSPRGEDTICISCGRSIVVDEAVETVTPITELDLVSGAKLARTSGIKKMIAGSLWALTSGVLTIGVVALYPNNWTFRIGYGTTAIGVIQVLRGLFWITASARVYVAMSGELNANLVKTRRVLMALLILFPLLGAIQDSSKGSKEEPKQLSNYIGVSSSGGTVQATAQNLATYTYTLACTGESLSWATPIGKSEGRGTNLFVSPLALDGCRGPMLSDGYNFLKVSVTDAKQGVIHVEYSIDSFKVAPLRKEGAYTVPLLSSAKPEVLEISAFREGIHWRAGSPGKNRDILTGAPLVDDKGRVVGVLDGSGSVVPIT